MFSSPLRNCLPVSVRKFSAGIIGSEYESVVGIEVHAQLTSNSKLFSGASNDRKAPANTVVSLFDAATPGTLPRLNKKCVESAVKTAIALNCNINRISMFDRKHYFYADSPAGYQITQQRKPIAVDGELSFYVINTRVPYKKTSSIRQIQLEQDSGKSLHFPETRTSLVDLNRAGVPLIEIVFDPDLSTGEEAAALLKELSLILTKLDACSCDMYLGALRCDANVSLHKKGEPLGVRTEVKNISSFRAVAKAIDFEINRQLKVLQSGGKIVNETRNWDAALNKTISMRDKEVVQDYRFLPEPNLPPLNLKSIDVDHIANCLPELPAQTRDKLRKYNLTIGAVEILVLHKNLFNLFTSAVEQVQHEKTAVVASHLISTHILNSCNRFKIERDEYQMTTDNFFDLVKLILDQRVSNASILTILDDLAQDAALSVHEIFARKNLEQITDRHEIEKICLAVIEENPKSFRRLQNGKEKELHKLLMRADKKTAHNLHMGIAAGILRQIANEKPSNE